MQINKSILSENQIIYPRVVTPHYPILVRLKNKSGLPSCLSLSNHVWIWVGTELQSGSITQLPHLSRPLLFVTNIRLCVPNNIFFGERLHSFRVEIWMDLFRDDLTFSHLGMTVILRRCVTVTIMRIIAVEPLQWYFLVWYWAVAEKTGSSEEESLLGEPV